MMRPQDAARQFRFALHEEVVMTSQNVRRYNMLVRVKEFGSAHPELFPADSLGGRTLADVGAVVDRLTASLTSESSGRRAARQGALSKAAARATLRRALEAISRTALGIGVDTPDVADRFVLPVQSDHALATAARQFADDAPPLASAFVAHGLPASFVADLQAALEAFERASSGHATATETHVGARAAITAAINAGMATLPRLDAIVENRIGGDPKLLAAWRSARHVEQRAPARTGEGTPEPGADATPPGVQAPTVAPAA